MPKTIKNSSVASLPKTKKPTAIEAARAMAKTITNEAVAKAAPPATKVATTQQAAPVSTFYATKVTSVGAPKQGKPGTFFGDLQALAAKPVTLEELIGTMAKGKFTSKKDPLFVAKVRTRHAYSKLGYLVAA
jgi:hypothetical protein